MSQTVAAALAVLLGSWTAAPAQVPGDDPLAASRAEFLAAWARIAPGLQPSIQPGDEPLAAYPLYPYLQAARLQRALAAAVTATAGSAGDPNDDPSAGAHAALDADVAKFIALHDGEPVADGLRHNWLASLANRGQWTLFRSQYRADTTDATLRCHALRAQIEAAPAEAVPAILAQWLEPAQLPSACEPAFEWLRQQRGPAQARVLTDDLIERRVRLILEQGDARFARLIARPLPAARAEPLLQWAALLEEPRREIDALIATPGKPVEPRALLDGWERLVRVNMEDARSRYARLVRARKLSEAEASPYALALALRLSWNRDPETLAWFARVRAADYDDAALEWRARASLWRADWPQVEQAITAMSPATRDTARWRYWAGRAAERRGESLAARGLFTSVLASDNYYSAMAAAHLGQTVTPNPSPVAADGTALARLQALPGFVRAHELLRAGMRDEAYDEWQHAYRNLPVDLQPQTVHLGMRWGWYDVSIATATQQRIFADYALLYPQPYATHVEAAARAAGLPRELIYGVLRQESLYRSDAVSSAGAVGLLQLLPETARLVARRAERPAPRRADLFDPAVNTALGAVHLRELADRFEGQMPLALASYNAGPNAARRWLPDGAIDTDVWIENIPYNETRAYVQRILWHSLVFSWLATGQPQDTRSWLSQTAPLTASG